MGVCFALQRRGTSLPAGFDTNRVRETCRFASGITKRIGWHWFRHTHSTLLRANGTDLKVQSELLRHSNIGTTLNVYTQAVSEENARRSRAIVGQLLPA
ncbi:MAG TPA: tyrosine-type recombinase/integrase [Terriglobales bacterium]|nr:tyrosine-type recombinase/integrase [Terriglobales bacterium]